MISPPVRVAAPVLVPPPGAGFAVMAQRAEAAGRDFTPFYLRRSAGLLLIGLCHALLVWSGDILVIYALVSLPLPLT